MVLGAGQSRPLFPVVLHRLELLPGPISLGQSHLPLCDKGLAIALLVYHMLLMGRAECRHEQWRTCISARLPYQARSNCGYPAGPQPSSLRFGWHSTGEEAFIGLIVTSINPSDCGATCTLMGSQYCLPVLQFSSRRSFHTHRGWNRSHHPGAATTECNVAQYHECARTSGRLYSQGFRQSSRIVRIS